MRDCPCYILYLYIGRILILTTRFLFPYTEDLSKDDAFRDETSTGKISKRAVQSAKTTFNRLKSTFVGLAGKKGARGRPRFRGRPSSSKKPGMGQTRILFVCNNISNTSLNFEKNFETSLLDIHH
jgi:hypothetical protein